MQIQKIRLHVFSSIEFDCRFLPALISEFGT
jgi:hypothetical protein